MDALSFIRHQNEKYSDKEYHVDASVEFLLAGDELMNATDHNLLRLRVGLVGRDHKAQAKLEIIDPNGLWTDNKPFEIGVGYVHISPLKCITADDLFPHCSICGAVVYLSERGFICPAHGIVESKEIDLRQRDS
jgi:hypothetical protein